MVAKKAKPAPAVTGNRLQIDQLGSAIDQNRKSTRQINQQVPFGRRAAYLARQKRVAERAVQKAEAPQSAIAVYQASARTTTPSERDGLNTGRANAVQPQRLTPEQRRSMDLLGVEIDRITQADRKFFERFAQQRHLIRLATRAEIEQMAIIHCQDQTLPIGFRHHVAVRNVAPGLRLRIFIIGCEGNDTDLSEMEACAIFDAHAGDKARKLERLMRAAAVRRGE
jgi:hypothetical protein